MNRAQIIQQVKQITRLASFDLAGPDSLEDPYINALVQEAERRIFLDVGLAEHFHFTVPEHTVLNPPTRFPLYHLPDKFSRVSAVSMYGMVLPLRPLSYNYYTNEEDVVSLIDYGYNFYVDHSGSEPVRYLAIVPCAIGRVEMDWYEEPLSINPGRNEIGREINPTQSNGYTERYPSLYWNEISRLVYAHSGDDVGVARMEQFYQEASMSAKQAEGGRQKPRER